MGYILGRRTAGITVAGGSVSRLGVISAIVRFGEKAPSAFFPETMNAIAQSAPGEIWSRYIPYISAGGVAFAGVITVLKSLPTMCGSIRARLAHWAAPGPG